MNYLTSNKVDGDGHDVFSLRITPDRGMTMIDLYVPRERAEIECLNLSKLLPDHAIQLEKYSRCKAVYRRGERVIVNDYKEYYIDLTREQYESTKILCTTTHKWI